MFAVLLLDLRWLLVMFINTPFFIFQDGGRPPSWIFLKFEISTAGPVQRANMRHHAKCCANRSNMLTK